MAHQSIRDIAPIYATERRRREEKRVAAKGDVKQEDDGEYEEVGTHGAEGPEKVSSEDYRASAREGQERGERSFKTDKEGKFWRRRAKAVPTS